MKRIALIEDDPTVREELALLLENEGYQVLGVTDFAAVPRQVQAFGADLVLLDLGLPGKDGFALCAALRRESPVPIIIVTSRDSALDELKALSLGGDDYITKPYNIPILLARIKAVLRRTGEGGEADTLTAGPLTLHLTRGTAATGGPDGGADPERAEDPGLPAGPPRADRAPGRPHRGPVGQPRSTSTTTPSASTSPGCGPSWASWAWGRPSETRRGMGYQYDGTGLSR